MTAPLRIAIVHYHLRPGGVTRLIGHAVRAVTPAASAVVVVGEAPPPPSPVAAPVRLVPALRYADAPRASAEDAAKELRASARSALGAEPDVWHVHNSALGKTPVLPAAVRRLAASGARVLLHIHDFPEDGRPADYRRLLDVVAGGDPARLGDGLYPQAPQIHYAVLNRRDERFLSYAGVPADRLHLLPNAVWVEAEPAAPAPADEPPLYLYPTRAIRRKNLGEFLLWAAVAEPGTRWATTFAPENPREQAAYAAWVALARDLGLPVRFAVGSSAASSFAELARAARALVTTSVAEGFGMAFLEPWLLGREVVGRNLPEITDEFAAAGVDVTRLYSRLDVPLDWVGRDEFHARLRASMQAAYGAYGRTPTASDFEAAAADSLRGTHVDFGRLDAAMQSAVIRRVAASPELCRAMAPARLQPAVAAPALIAANAAAVRRAFGLEDYGRKLLAVYRRLQAEIAGPLNGLAADRLLNRFLDPARFFMVRA